MQITLRRQPRTESIILGLLPLLAMIMLAVILEFAALPALAAEPFHYPAVLRSGKKIGDLVPIYQPGSFTEFIELVVPELQRRGRMRTGYDGATLRENLFGEGHRRLLPDHPAYRIAGVNPDPERRVRVALA